MLDNVWNGDRVQHVCNVDLCRHQDVVRLDPGAPAGAGRGTRQPPAQRRGRHAPATPPLLGGVHRQPQHGQLGTLVTLVSDIISRHNWYHEHAAHQAGGEEAEDADEEQGEGGDCDQHPAVRDNSSSSWSLVVELRLCHLVGKCSNGS